MKTVYALALIYILTFTLALTCPAYATDQQDLSVALKTLPLLTTKMTSPASVVIVYDPAAPESKQDAEGIKAIIDNGLEAPGDIKLSAQMLSTVDPLKLSGVRIVFMAQGLPARDYDNIASVASAVGALTICTDIDCVRANKCVLGVVSKPRVEVYYSPAAADRSKISFVSAFTMLAKQVGAL
jgi:hypothetical protein